MTESDIRRIVREELEAADKRRLQAIVDEINGPYDARIADEVQKRFDNDPGFLRR